jgi:4-amino-4-deoxy-L-arabinose transferase-like glycosyltransferase
MWVTGLPVEIYKQISGERIYNHENFEDFDFTAKISLVFVQFVLTILILFILSQLLGFWSALGITVFYSFEPFFTGNSRLYHLDTLFSLLTFLSLLFVYSGLEKRNNRHAVLGGVFGGLAFLTKSIGIGIFVYVFLALFWAVWKKYVTTRYMLIFLSTFLLSVFVFFPALWVRPAYYIAEIFSESERIGLRRGHEQIVFGETLETAGPEFYFLVLLVKFSPFILLGTFFYFSWNLYKAIKGYKIAFTSEMKVIIFTGIFYLGYFLVMTLSSKKIDRYMVTLFPYFAVLAWYGYKYLGSYVKKSRIFLIFILVIYSLFVATPLMTFYPYYFTYTSSLMGSTENANNVIAQKPFGVGIHDLKNLIVTRYGENTSLGFIDTKPIKAIYPNSQVFDMRINGISDYDVLVLGINEDFPQNVKDTNVSLYKDSSLYINGLEYWRLYVKQK